MLPCGLVAAVRKGEKGTAVVYAGSLLAKDTNEATGDEEARAIRYLKSYTVFNVTQIDGLPDRFHQAGFAWGDDAGDGARQLAFAIATDHLDSPDEAVYKPIEHMLLHECAAGHSWILTALEIACAIDELELER